MISINSKINKHSRKIEKDKNIYDKHLNHSFIGSDYADSIEWNKQ